MILIHTALLCEAQSFIEYYNLKKTNSSPKIYANETILICISGVGKENTFSSLKYLYANYSISKALNIGIAGCNDTNKEIGSLFCTNNKLTDIPYLNLITKDEITTQSISKDSILYDMEAKYFEEISLEYLSKNSIFVFKIVSDYLSDKKLAKDFIKQLVAKQKILHQFIQLK